MNSFIFGFTPFWSDQDAILKSVASFYCGDAWVNSFYYTFYFTYMMFELGPEAFYVFAYPRATSHNGDGASNSFMLSSSAFEPDLDLIPVCPVPLHSSRAWVTLLYNSSNFTSTTFGPGPDPFQIFFEPQQYLTLKGRCP